MGIRAFHPGKLGLFTALSVTDLGLTYHLLGHTNGRIYETNPIADAWLDLYGWPGLALFKLSAMFLVAGLVVLISLYRPRASGHILGFACVAVAVVVVYSGSLLGSLPAQRGRPRPIPTPFRLVGPARETLVRSPLPAPPLVAE